MLKKTEYDRLESNSLFDTLAIETLLFAFKRLVSFIYALLADLYIVSLLNPLLISMHDRRGYYLTMTLPQATLNMFAGRGAPLCDAKVTAERTCFFMPSVACWYLQAFITSLFWSL